MELSEVDRSLRFSSLLADVRLSIEQLNAKPSIDEIVASFGSSFGKANDESGGESGGHLTGEESNSKLYAFLSLFFVLPFLQPIPIPGLSSVFGACLFFFGALLCLRKPPRLPKRIGRMAIEKKFLLRILQALEALLTKLERVTRRRKAHLFKNRRLSSFHGFLMAWHGFLLAIPLPVPFSNMLPAVCLTLFAVGMLEDDFLLIGLGYAAAIGNLFFFSALIFLPFALRRAWI